MKLSVGWERERGAINVSTVSASLRFVTRLIIIILPRAKSREIYLFICPLLFVAKEKSNRFEAKYCSESNFFENEILKTSLFQTSLTHFRHRFGITFFFPEHYSYLFGDKKSKIYSFRSCSFVIVARKTNQTNFSYK